MTAEDKAKRPSIRDLQIDRPQSDAMKDRRMPDEARGAKRHRKAGLWWWIIAIVLLVVAFIISLPIIFSDTTLKITPVVTKAIFDDAIFNASSLESGQEEQGEALKYSKVKWTAEDSETLEPTGREQVKEKASGLITVYNNYTNKRQRLIKNTRFETKDGKVYRVRNSIMVPGKTASGPGTLDVKVYADEAGENYNIISGDLTLPGLKSLPDMYSTIYAKVKSPIAGGYKGERAVVSDADKSRASAGLRNKIKSDVMAEATSRVPADSRYFNSGVEVTFADTQVTEVEGKVLVTERADVSVIVFNKKEFAKIISQGVAGNPEKGFPTIKDDTTLKVNIDNQSEQDTIKIVVNGNADFVWMFDKEELKQDLISRQREALKTILKGYPSIKKAEAIIRPFWRSSFPNKSSDFTIEILDVE